MEIFCGYVIQNIHKWLKYWLQKFILPYAKVQSMLNFSMKTIRQGSPAKFLDGEHFMEIPNLKWMMTREFPWNKPSISWNLGVSRFYFGNLHDSHGWEFIHDESMAGLHQAGLAAQEGATWANPIFWTKKRTAWLSSHLETKSSRIFWRYGYDIYVL